MNEPISADRLALKFHALRNFEQPEIAAQLAAEPGLSEALWFIQWASWSENYAGGLLKLAADLVDDSLDLIGTPTMRASSRSRFTDEELIAIGEEMPRGIPSLSEADSFNVEIPFCGTGAISRLDRAQLVTYCAAEAKKVLPEYLRSLCTNAAVGFYRSAGRSFKGGCAPWCFADVAKALVRWVQRWREREGQSIAETEVSRLIFKNLDRARGLRKSVMIEGNSRFGKTECVRAWCRANPGRARFIDTPSGNSELELLWRVADALGIDRRALGRPATLRAEIEDVARLSGLMFVFEEAHALWPDKFTRNTAPARLNWIRRGLMDAGNACAFVCTPQRMAHARGKFLRATGWVVEQFDARILLTVKLPEAIDLADLRAVARHHLPGVAESALEMLATLAAITERNFVSDVVNVADLARVFASEGGRDVPSLADLRAAIAEVIPQAAAIAAAPAAAPGSVPAETPAQTAPRSRRPSPASRPAADALQALGSRREFAPDSAVEHSAVDS